MCLLFSGNMAANSVNFQEDWTDLQISFPDALISETKNITIHEKIMPHWIADI